MPGDREIEFDEAASSADAYYLEGAIVRLNGSVYLVGNTRRVKGTRMRAWLQFLEAPTEEELATATEWGWDRDRQVMRWMPI